MKILIPIAIIVSIGVGIIAYGYRYPMFTNIETVEQLNDIGYERLEKGEPSKEVSKWWYEQREKYETPHKILIDSGASIIIFGLSLMAIVYICNIKSFKDIYMIATPDNKRSLYIIGNAAWAALMPAMFLNLNYTAARGDYPAWADTILIPLIQTGIGWLVLLPIVNILIWLVSWKAKMPVNIWIWSKSNILYAWFWTIIFGLVGAVLIFLLAMTIYGGGIFIVPVLLSWICIIIYSRAIVIGKKAA